MVRALVLGAGAAGERHGRALRGLADRCALVGVHDPDLEAARATAKALDVPVLEHLDAALDSAEAAVVAGALGHRPTLVRRALERVGAKVTARRYQWAARSSWPSSR